MVLDYLNRVDGACLALACKDIYPYHRLLNGTVSLLENSQDDESHPYLLGHALQVWSGLEFWFDKRVCSDGKFKRWKELEGEQWF